MSSAADEQPTQPIPPETLAECARMWRERLARDGLCEVPQQTEAARG